MKDKPGRVPRIHLEQAPRAGARLELPETAAHHALRVLRLRAGDALTLFDGSGGEWSATVASAARGRLAVEIGAWYDIERESPLRVTLVQGVSSGERMDATVQKATELGVATLQPVLGQKSVVKLAAERAAARVAHWRRVAIAACEQCGRNRLPEVLAVLSLDAYCRTAPPGMRLLLSPDARRPLGSVAARVEAPVTLAAGPEAGFSPAEEAMLEAVGFIPVALGPRVLRTENAAAAALAALAALAGEF
jgi:16S rRNA (uracil1498-N3)-methyltransferase